MKKRTLDKQDTLSLNVTSQKWSDRRAHNDTDTNENHPKITSVTPVSPRSQNPNSAPLAGRRGDRQPQRPPAAALSAIPTEGNSAVRQRQCTATGPLAPLLGSVACDNTGQT